MDFIESWLGVSPDGGNGSLEAFLLTLVGVVCAVVFRACISRLIRRWRLARGACVDLS